MKRKIALLLVTLLFYTTIFSQDTFSIVAIDAATGEIGAAGATCSDGIADYNGVQNINKIMPGKGAVNAQAWICLQPSNTNLDYAIDQISLNFQAPQVLEDLLDNDQCSAQNYNIDFRQYGIITINSTGNIQLMAYTGSRTTDAKGARTGDNYVIIGNNLTGDAVLDAMENGFIKEEGTLADKLLAAMHGGKRAGGDYRCSDRGTSSTSTFLKVAKPNDLANFPYLFINIPGVPMGVEPIDSLQILYDDFLVDISNSIELINNLSILFTPVQSELFFTLNLNPFSIFDVAIYNISGLAVYNQTSAVNQSVHKINLPKLSNGSYLLSIKTEAGFASKKFQVLKF